MKRRKLILLFALLIIGLWANLFAQTADEAIMLSDKGWNAYQQKRYEEALKYYEEALEINQKLKIAQGVARNLNRIGLVYLALYRNDEALKYFEDALTLNKKINNHSQMAANINNIGRVHESRSQYDEALKFYEESLKINRELNIRGEIITNLSNIGRVYSSLCQFGKALNYYNEALKISRELGKPSQIAVNLNRIGLVYSSLGRYEEALNYYGEALKINRELKNRGPLAANTNNIGTIYSFFGRYDEALKYYEEALKIQRDLINKIDIAMILGNIGGAYMYFGRNNEALKYYEEALKINMELNDNMGIGRTLNLIGWAYLTLKDYEKAEKFFKEAEKTFNKVETTIFRGWLRSGGLIETYLKTGRFREALNLINEKIPQWSNSPSTLIRYHTQKGCALKGTGSLKDAAEEFLESVLMTEEMRQRAGTERSEFFETAGRMSAYKGLVATLAERFIKGERKDRQFIPYGQDLASAAFYFAESTKGRALLEAITKASKGTYKGKITERLRKREQDILGKLAEIESQWIGSYQKGKDSYKWLKKQKDQIIKEHNALIKELREKDPRYALLYHPNPVPPENLFLREDELLLEYSIGEDASYVFVVRKGGVKRIVKIPISHEVLEQKVRDFMNPMETRDFSAFSTKGAKELYDILLANALEDVKENEKVIIVTEGILGLLPFEALVMQERAGVKDSVYVGDRYSLSYYQSATIMAFNRAVQREAAERVLFALGNPVYSKEDPRYAAWKSGKKEQVLVANLDKYSFRALTTGRGVEIIGKEKKVKELEYRPLPETEKEVVDISRILGIEPAPPDVLISVMANETEFKKVTLEKYRYVHFATHADLPGEVQGIYEPFILLGQVENTEGDDGFLTLSEVLGLKLNADMVVLSACRTGMGKIMEGEGVINFARAFQHAGAMSVVVSLWEVASDEAVEYMKTFYKHLKDGKNRREAMTLTRKEIKAKYPNPFFWAVFILHGEG